MKRRRLDYLILLYMAIFLMGAVLQSCEFGTGNKEEPDPEEPEETVTDSIFEIESMANVTEEVDGLFKYGYPFEANKLNDSTYVFQGDILIDAQKEVTVYEPGEEPPRTFQGVARTTGLWPNGLIYYQFSPNLHAYAKQDAIDAMKWLSENTNLSFKEEANSIGYVVFSNGSGCSSYIGKIGRSQVINLGSQRCGFGSTVHEILHAAGFWHEQARTDRDQYIKILKENISPGTEHNFLMTSAYPSTPSTLMSPFDFNSIMLYSSLSFSRNGQPTIVKLDGSRFSANRTKPSQYDVESVNKLYPALEPEKPTEPTKPVEPEIPPTPTYENGKYYTVNGLFVLRYNNTWYTKNEKGWFEVVIKRNSSGAEYWSYVKETTDPTKPVEPVEPEKPVEPKLPEPEPEETKYVEGKWYRVNGIMVLRKNGEWYYNNRIIYLVERPDGSVKWTRTKP